MIRIQNSTRAVTENQRTSSERGVRSLLKREDIGFFRLPEREENWSSSEKRAQTLRGQYKKMVVLGIGGSSLGGRALQHALRPGSSDQLEFFENVDGQDFWRRIQGFKDLASIHWVITSKSGNTIETLTQASFIDQHLQNNGLALKDHCTVISERKKNPLTDWANENHVPTLEIPLDVGGRFSVLTPVGLLPAAFLGIDIQDLRRGARWSLQNPNLISELVAQSLLSFEHQEWLTLFWMYCDRLRDTGLWIQQLWAESLAKKRDHKQNSAPRVSTPLPLIGANDQHSVLQQIMEGYPDKFVWFVRVKESETCGPTLKRHLFPTQSFLESRPLGALLAAEAQATARALKEAQVDSLVLELDQLGAAEMGALFMALELVVGGLGECLEINAYDQPGVELGKRLAREILMTARL